MGVFDIYEVLVKHEGEWMDYERIANELSIKTRNVQSCAKRALTLKGIQMRVVLRRRGTSRNRCNVIQLKYEGDKK